MLLSTTPVWKFERHATYIRDDGTPVTAQDIMLQYGCSDEILYYWIPFEQHTEELFDWIKKTFPDIKLRNKPLILSGKLFKTLYPGTKYTMYEGNLCDEDYAIAYNIKNKVYIPDNAIMKVYQYRVRHNQSAQCYHMTIPARL